MTQFGSDFRQQRKLMKEVLGTDVIRNHEALLNEEGVRLLEGILTNPKGFDRYLRRSANCDVCHTLRILMLFRFSSSLALRMVYGFEAMEINDPHILLAEEMMQTSEYAVIAGWAVDFLPICRLQIIILSVVRRSLSQNSETSSQMASRRWIQKEG